MTDPGLNSLLKWGIENSENSRTDPAQVNPPRGLEAQALATLLGGPSDADLMREAMSAVVSPEVDLDNKLTAFDNFEQLIENLDNANNMESLGLWTPLVEQLKNEEAELRKMAAWCVGTAAQNNVRAQDRVLALGAIPTLVHLATNDDEQAVRKKAILAVSSAIRNYQPGLDMAVEALPEGYKGDGKIDAADMDAVDVLINRLRDKSQKRG